MQWQQALAVSRSDWSRGTVWHCLAVTLALLPLLAVAAELQPVLLLWPWLCQCAGRRGIFSRPSLSFIKLLQCIYVAALMLLPRQAQPQPLYKKGGGG